MRLTILILVLVLVLLASAATTEKKRSERSIRDWFSGIFKRFQNRENRRQPYYLHQTYQQLPSPSHHFQGQFNGHHSSFGHHGGGGHGHGGGHFQHHTGGHGNIHAGHGGSHNGHGGGHGGKHVGQNAGSHGGGHSSGHGGGHSGDHHGGHGVGQIPQGFGPLKTSDIIHAEPHNPGVNHVPHVEVLHEETLVHSGEGGSIHAHGFESGAHDHGGNINVGDGSHENIHLPKPIDVVPVAPDLDIDYDLHPSSELAHNTVNKGDHSVHIPPSNSISPTNPQYITPKNVQLPLEEKEGDILLQHHSFQGQSVHQNQLPFEVNPSEIYGLDSEGSTNQVVVSGRPGDSVFAPNLGPHDPIIEIVFQDGEPAQPHPPHVIDPALYEPVSDDVEVFFIEYSPEDGVGNLEDLDLSSAQPAILQDLPAELPFELRNHLINSGVLENAQIEIIDLDSALTDHSLDSQTRNALQQAYTRTHRQIKTPKIEDAKPQNKQAVDIRVKRVNHDTRTPEGIVDYLSGLRKFRRGTFAGVVEVNDKKTNKFLPLTLDGNKLPLPDNIALENKKVDGVLVLAPESERKGREAKASFPESRQLQRFTSKSLKTSIAQRSQPAPISAKRRLLDIDWADMDTNGWIPMINVDT